MIFPRFRSNFIVFGTKKTKILKIHVRFFKIQNRPIFPDIVSKSEIITPSELEAILILRLRIFFCKKKICGWSGMNLLFNLYMEYIFVVFESFGADWWIVLFYTFLKPEIPR